MKTRAQIKRQLLRSGVSIREWARAHGYPHGQVRDVLRGRAKGRRGASHNIAVLLGLKDGEINPAHVHAVPAAAPAPK